MSIPSYEKKTLLENFTGTSLPSDWGTWTVGSGNSYSVNNKLTLTTGSSGNCQIGAYLDDTVDFGVSAFVEAKITYANIELILRQDGYPDTDSLNIAVNKDFVTSGANTGSGWATVDYIANDDYEYFRIVVFQEHAYFLASKNGSTWVDVADCAYEVDSTATTRYQLWLWDEDNAGSAVFDDIYHGWLGFEYKRDIYSTVHQDSSSNRSIYSTVYQDGSSNRSIYSEVYSEEGFTRGIHSLGGLEASYERGIYSSTYGEGSSLRGIYSQGGESDFSMRGIYSDAAIRLDYSRNIYSTTKGSSSSNRGIYSVCELEGNYYRGIYSVGTTVGPLTMYTWDDTQWVEVTDISIYMGG